MQSQFLGLSYYYDILWIKGGPNKISKGTKLIRCCAWAAVLIPASRCVGPLRRSIPILGARRLGYTNNSNCKGSQPSSRKVMDTLRELLERRFCPTSRKRRRHPCRAPPPIAMLPRTRAAARCHAASRLWPSHPCRRPPHSPPSPMSLTGGS